MTRLLHSNVPHTTNELYFILDQSLTIYNHRHTQSDTHISSVTPTGASSPSVLMPVSYRVALFLPAGKVNCKTHIHHRVTMNGYRFSFVHKTVREGIWLCYYPDRHTMTALKGKMIIWSDPKINQMVGGKITSKIWVAQKMLSGYSGYAINTNTTTL